MLSAIRRTLLRVTLPLSWRRGPAQKARTLQRFSRIEYDSGWQFLQALEVLDDPAERARMFLNAMEEHHHGALFGNLARTYMDRPLPTPPDKRQALLERADGLGEFLAYIHLGEHDIYEEFEVYAQVSGDEAVAELFMAIREDEEGHQDSAHEMLAAAMGGSRELRRGLARARRKRMWHAWKHMSEQAGEGISTVLLSLVYFVVVPVFSLLAGRRQRRRPVDGARVESPGDRATA